MYSTSSSECGCEEYCTCSYEADVYENQYSYGRTPFYPTMGHPLVYYAQVPSNIQPSRESRKDNKNCFSKAFRWYTQEHVPHPSISPNKTDMSTFAAWLDSKYDEFVRDSQLDSVYHLKVKQTAVIEADKIPKNPWRRKRRNGSKEAGDTIQKQTQSFQFILLPKDLARPASECRQPSNDTMRSTEIPMRYTIKSHSYTVISQEPTDCTICEGKKHECDEKSKPDLVDKKISQRKTLQNISCQCSLAKVVKANAQSQYEDTNAERVCDNQITPKEMFSLCQSSRNDTPNKETSKVVLPSKEVQAKVRNVQLAMFCQCPKEPIIKTDSQIQLGTEQNVERLSSLSFKQSSSQTGKTCPCESQHEFVENLTHFSSPITFCNGGVQTSDHSIQLEKDAMHGYPLFMKIVCADKLCK